MEPDSKGMSNVLVITDQFTRYAQAFPTKNQRAQTAAKILVDKYFVYYGLPSRINLDQGRDFENHLIKDLLNMPSTNVTDYSVSPPRRPSTR